MILLLNPPPLKSKNYIKDPLAGGKSHLDAVYPPLELSYVAALLQENGIKVDLLDANALDMSLEDLKKHITKNPPSVVILMTVTTSYMSDIKTIEFIKQIIPDVKFALFGAFATSSWHEIMKNELVDFTMLGEPEITCLELTEALLNGGRLDTIDGLVWRNDEKIIQNEPREFISDLDVLPFPARDLLPVEKYRHPLCKSNPITFMRTSRGCTYDCLFCGTKIMHKRKWRGRDPEKVVDEMQEIREKYGIKEIWICDEEFLLDRDRVIEICKEMINMSLDICFTFNGRVNLVDEELLTYLRKAGCYKIDYGVETGDPGILETIRKGVTLEQIEDAFKLTKMAGIETGALLVTGMPGENMETVKRTAKFVKKLDPTYAIYHIATPFPGTDFYKMAKKEGWIINENLEDFDLCQSVISYPDFTMRDIEKAQKWAYNQFYLSPSFICKRLIKIRSVNDIKGLGEAVLSYTRLIKNLNR